MLNMISLFNMITEINESKTLPKHMPYTYRRKCMEENVIEINGGTTINIDVSVKSIIYVKRIIFGILLHAVAKMVNI